MKKIAALLVVLAVFSALTVVAFADTFNGTMVRPNNADPNLFFYNGKYYMTQTGTSRIAVFETEHVDDLATLALSKNISYTAYLNGKVYDPAVTELFGSGATINGTWSPELHYFSEEEFPGMSGWYMFLGLRKNTGDSSMVRMVVLKSMTNSPKGPYGHPTKGTANYSQPVLDKSGNVWDEWACGQTTLTIPEGPYKGTYAMWVAEEGRGQSGATGKFYQKIMIAKMKSPWQFDGEPGIITTPTQQWEYAGASSTHPRVVEGATPVYGKNGEIFITYSGSGYWSDYGLGQLTWNGGDPLETSSWVKLSTSRGNPIFSAVDAENIRGAGHASFLTDTDGNGFLCYHAYAFTDGKRAASRDAYIEPYYIDYTKWNGVSYGVITIGLDKNGIPADSASTVYFATNGEYLTAPDLAANGDTTITLTMSERGATGYLIYKSTDGKTFDYLATVDSSSYTDTDVELGSTYYYRAYAYREEEISDVSVTVSAKAKSAVAAPTITAQASGDIAMFGVTAACDYDGFEIYYSEDNEEYFFLYNSGSPIAKGETQGYSEGNVFAEGVTYYVKACGYVGNNYSEFSEAAEFTMPLLVNLEPPTITAREQTSNSIAKFVIAMGDDYDGLNIYHSTDGEIFELKRSFESEYSFGSRLSASVYVSSGGTHYFYATGTLDGYETEPSDIIAINVIAIEDPEIIKVENTCNSITLTFSEIPENGSYIVGRGELVKIGQYSSYYDFSDIATVTDSVYVLENVNVGEEYILGVMAEIGGISSEFSDPVTVTPAHKEVSADGLDATCTTDGYTAYTYCAYCEAVLSGKEVIPATGHIDTTETTVDATCTADGSVTVTCKCGEVVSTEVIPAKGHSYELAEEEIPATTTSVGKTALYTCACGDSYGGEEIPMLEAPTLAGDANGDGIVNVLDVLRTLKVAVGMDASINIANADVDESGSVDVADVLAILQMILAAK